MAYDEGLAQRLRARLDGAVEKKMFGGLAFLVGGNMCVGVHGEELIARVGPDATAAALERPGARLFDMTGRPMSGWVMVAPDGVADDKALDGWVEDSLAFVRTLPPK